MVGSPSHRRGAPALCLSPCKAIPPSGATRALSPGTSGPKHAPQSPALLPPPARARRRFSATLPVTPALRTSDLQPSSHALEPMPSLSLKAQHHPTESPPPVLTWRIA